MDLFSRLLNKAPRNSGVVARKRLHAVVSQDRIEAPSKMGRRFRRNLARTLPSVTSPSLLGTQSSMR